MKERKNTVKVIGLGNLGGQVINLLLKSNFKPVAEEAFYIDQELLIDSATGNMYFFQNDVADRRGFIPKIKSLEKYVWPGDEFLEPILKGTDLVILIIGLGGAEAVHWSQLISKTSQKIGVSLVVLATHPFNFESKLIQEIAKETVKELRQSTDWVLLFPLDRLLTDYPQEANLSGLLKKAGDKLGGIVAEIVDQVSLLGADRDHAGLRKALMKIDGRFREFDGKWGEIPSKGILKGELIGKKHPIYFDELEHS
jgi:cell division GTPase FtsZ